MLRPPAMASALLATIVVACLLAPSDCAGTCATPMSAKKPDGYADYMARFKKSYATCAPPFPLPCCLPLPCYRSSLLPLPCCRTLAAATPMTRFNTSYATCAVCSPTQEASFRGDSRAFSSVAKTRPQPAHSAALPCCGLCALHGQREYASARAATGAVRCFLLPRSGMHHTGTRWPRTLPAPRLGGGSTLRAWR